MTSSGSIEQSGSSIEHESSRTETYWTESYRAQNAAARENFFGNLQTFRKAAAAKDPYALQLARFGMDLERREPYRFEQAIAIVEKDLQAIGQQYGADHILLPAKAFRLPAHGDGDGDNRPAGGTVIFVRFGESVPADAEPLNLLSPDVFVNMLASGFFPIGEPIREGTNQTLAEHDLAHLCGFISDPEYMRCIREAFRRIQTKLEGEHGKRLACALSHFDSLYSLRLYYLIEIFTEIRADKRARLQELLGSTLPVDADFDQIKPMVLGELQRRARESVADLYSWLDTLYSEFHQIVNPLGGESRDILNRRRKFQRGSAQNGSPYDRHSKFTSKFNGNSIYSLFQNAVAALENVRSNHIGFSASLELVHAPLIGALVGTAQLSIEDWVLQAIEEVPDPESKLWRYLNLTGFWETSDLIRLCHSHPSFDAVPGNLQDFDSLATELAERMPAVDQVCQ
jgi:hypothetical protein